MSASNKMKWFCVNCKDFNSESGAVVNQVKNCSHSDKILSDLKDSVNFLIGVPEQENEDCCKIVEEMSLALGEAVSVTSAYRYRSKVPNKIGKIVAVLSSYKNKKSLMEMSRKKKLKAKNVNANWNDEDELLLFLQNDSDFHLDVIVLTETWHDPKNCIYSLPGSPSDIINEFLTRLEAILMSDKDIVDSTMTILLGDININIIGNDNVENNYLDLLSSNGFSSLINRVSGDPKNTWKLIKNLTNKPNTDNDIIKRLNYNGNIIDAQKEPLTASNHLNMFFSTIGQNLANKIDKCFDEVSDERTPVINFNNFFSVKIHSMEIMNIINHFKDDVACGFDKINVKILKNLAPYIINPLTHIFNLSLRLGIFPDKLKVAIIKPLHKGGDKENMNNYRPISMLSSFSKIFEKIIKARLIDYLENNSLLSKNQYGFRPRRSTEDALYAVTTFISKALDKGDKALGIFLDLAKAFDTVDHSLLIKVFNSYGINGICLNWFKSYLNKRKQITNMNGVLGQSM
ncbi:uncharacterized protein LOC132925747 [Rhopalosiphum padi]|uniref:uncharacterized protein LOC132925747 n=1 Tax=Rhopalosiphum padi TaxID=40932 RepID=UPI00298E8005|nr:uncharacterized protein LOC132925747 [Rhopalosiphum padi]